MRTLSHHSLNLVDVAIAAHGVGDAIVGVAQSRITFLQQIAIFARIGGLEHLFALVGLDAAVDDVENLAAMLERGVFNKSAKSSPVLRLVVGAD